MAAAATLARQQLAGLLSGTVPATEHALPEPLRFHDRDIMLEEAEESIYKDRPFQILPTREVTRGRTIANRDTDTTIWYTLKVGFLHGYEATNVAETMELTVEQVRRVLMSSLNWGTPTSIQRVVVNEVSYTYAPAPDRRTLIRAEVEVDLRSDWTVVP